MATTLKAIDTPYAGHLFRSRLEARVAVFLDALGCSWSYEPEGYDLPFSGRYLPDFLVHDFPFGSQRHSIWIEVKGTDPTRAEVNAMRELCCATGHHGFFMVGTEEVSGFVETGIRTKRKELFKSFVQGQSQPSGLPPLCLLGMELLTHQAVPHSTFSPLIDGKDFSAIDPKAKADFYQELNQLLSMLPLDVSPAPFVHASKAALSARFEHGQSGS